MGGFIVVWKLIQFVVYPIFMAALEVYKKSPRCALGKHDADRVKALIKQDPTKKNGK